MLRDYVTELYAPAGRSSRAVSADGDAGAKELATWRQRVSQAWPSVAITHVDASGAGDTPSLGGTMRVRAVVMLGALNPSDVEVQALYGRVDDADEITGAATIALHPARADEMELDGGSVAFEGDVPLAKTGAFGYAVRVLPHHPLLATPVELGLMAVPGARSEGEAPPSW
jgi:starch phosphorylase